MRLWGLSGNEIGNCFNETLDTSDFQPENPQQQPSLSLIKRFYSDIDICISHKQT